MVVDNSRHDWPKLKRRYEAIIDPLINTLVNFLLSIQLVKPKSRETLVETVEMDKFDFRDGRRYRFKLVVSYSRRKRNNLVTSVFHASLFANTEYLRSSKTTRCTINLCNSFHVTYVSRIRVIRTRSRST